MNDDSAWQYDEFSQIGKDYADPDEAGNYDASHATFRDPVAEANAVLDRLDVAADACLIDFGCGTGTFALEAARRCARVYAVDVSPAMLRRARVKAAAARAENISFCHGGFLSYVHQGPPADVITTTFAFHHLPDYWKGVALGRLQKMLQAGGRFYLSDVVIAEDNSRENIAAFIEVLAAAGGDALREDTETHFREEFSTYDWVIDGLLMRSGFEIIDKRIDQGVLGHYLCRKP